MGVQKGIGVICFRLRKGIPEFLLVKDHYPFFSGPRIWNEFADFITEKDVILAKKIRGKEGDIIPDLLNRLSVIRLLGQKALFHSFHKSTLEKKHEEVYGHLLVADTLMISSMLHLIIPCCNITHLEGSSKYEIQNYSILAPINMKIKKDKLISKSKWFTLKQLEKDFTKLSKIFSPFVIHIIETYREKDFDINELIHTQEEQRAQNHIQTYVFPHIQRFSVPGLSQLKLRVSALNIYIIGNKKKYILDPGAKNLQALSCLEEYIQKNISLMEGILISHHHEPTCNFAKYLKEEYNLPIYASEYTAKILEEKGILVSHTLKNGDFIELGEYKSIGFSSNSNKKWGIEVISLPGHTKGFLGFYDTRKILFVGGTLLKDNVCVIDTKHGSATHYVKSLEKILSLSVKYGLPGEGGIQDNVKKHINYNKKLIKYRTNKLYNAIKQGVNSSQDLLNIITKDLPEQDKRLASNILETNLEILKNKGKITQRGTYFFISK